MLLRFLVLITFIFPISLVFGQDGLDVVFIIDQSGSMSGSILGSSSHPKPNDGKGKRIEAVRNAIIRLAEQVDGTPIIHRFSVIEFGTTERLNVPLSDQELSYNPSFPGLAEQNANRWTNNHLVAKNLGLTDTAGAMRAAVHEFSNLSPSLTGTRQRKLLLITDGRPCILVPRKKWCQPLSRLQRQIRDQTEKLEQMDVDIWIIGLNDADNYWNNGDGTFWETIAGRDKNGLYKARLAETADPHLEQRMQYIVDDWLNSSSQLITSTNSKIEYSIRPYLKRATFNVSVNKRGATLKIDYPDGQVKTLQASTWQGGSYTLRHDLDDPTPGTYQLEKAPGFSYKIHVENELPTAQFLSPMGSATKDETTRVVFQVMQTNGPLKEFPQWPLDDKTVKAAVTVTAPSGTVSSPLPAQFEGDGKFVADWTATEEGEHLFDFSGKISVQQQIPGGGIQQTEHELVDTSITHPNWKVTVDPNIPPLWLHLEPEPQDGLPISPWADTALLKLVLYEGEQPITTLEQLEKLVTEPATWLKLEQMDKSGVPLSQNAEIPLILEDGYFVAEIPIQLDWKNGEGWWYPGQIHLLVLDKQNQLPEDRPLNGLWLPQEAENQRLRGNPKTVSDIAIELSWFWWFLLVLLPIFLLMVGLIVGILHWLPCWSIRREDANRQVKLLIYDSYEDPGAKAPTKTVHLTGQCHVIKLDELVKISTKSAEYFRIKRMPNQGIPRVIIEYRWQGESKDKPHTIVLSGKEIAKPLEGLPSGNYVVGLSY